MFAVTQVNSVNYYTKGEHSIEYYPQNQKAGEILDARTGKKFF